MSAAQPTGTASQAAGRWVFPDSFVWGSATSAYQVEGAIEADGRGESIWDRFCRQPGAIVDGSSGAQACDQYHRFPADIAMMKDLGLDAYRFSIAWPRIVPAGIGAVQAAGLDHYERVVDALLDADIAPLVTLYHWDLPQALEDVGGWANRATVDAFMHYVDAVTARLGDRVPTWMTLNEPFVSWNHGYLTGEHAPGRRSLPDALAAAHHLLLAHGRAVPVIRANAPQARVGLVLNFTPVEPLTESAEDAAAAALMDGIENRWCVEPLAGLGYPADTAASLGWSAREVRDGDLATIATPIDVLGVNYYTTQFAAADPDLVPPASPATDMGWAIRPDGLSGLLRRLHDQYHFPAYVIAENGAAMPDQPDASGFVQDDDRIEYVRSHLAAVHDAMGAGVLVEGYFLWSLLDNFEWAHGYAKRFGIVRVDYETLQRTPKASARWYAHVARTGVVA